MHDLTPGNRGPFDAPVQQFTTTNLLYFGLYAVLACGGCLGGCQRSGVEDHPQARRSDQANKPEMVAGAGNARTARQLVNIDFTDDRTSGVDFVLVSGDQGNFTYPEIMCGGVCVADLDGDHDLDIYLPQAGSVPGQAPSNDHPKSAVATAPALFLNDGRGVFQDASANAGVAQDHYGMGAFAADVDDDGDLDLLLTNVGPVTLWVNNGDATFRDATRSSGIPQHEGLWMNAAFGDFNRDQILDVYIANYTDWSYDSAPHCVGLGGLADYCDPSKFAGAPDVLLIGNGDGTFRDQSAESGVSRIASRSMGVVTVDVDGDQDLDIYVACDGEENLLWINNGEGVFENEATIRGAALNAAGAAEASMGIACADIDADGDEDLIVSHLVGETHTVYRNQRGFFTDVTAAVGLGQWSRPDTGFGIGLVDFDNDTHLDLLVANGAVSRPTQPVDPANPYAQPDRVARGLPGGKFPEAMVIADMHSPQDAQVSRGAAFGDLNGDGLVDAVIVVKDGPLRILQNVTESSASWLGICPVEKPKACGSIGARVSLSEFPALGPRIVRPHGSYLSSSEDVVRFGLADGDAPVRAMVTWPDGTREQFESLALRGVHRLVRGTGATAGAELELAQDQSSPTTAQVAAQPRTSTSKPDGLAERGLSPAAVPASSALGPLPPLAFEPIPGKRSLAIKLDEKALDAWCRSAGLPPPPPLMSLDAPSWKLVYAAIEEAGRSPTATSLGNLAMLYDGLGAAESATALYERVIALAPTQAKWWHLLGRARLNHGDADLAVEALTTAVDLLPGKPAPIARLAEARLAVGQAEESRQLWSQYLTLRPNSPLACIGLARAFESLGQWDQALLAAERAIQLNSQAKSALSIAARLAAQTGHADRAADYARRADQLNPDNDPALFDEIEHEMLDFAKPVGYLRKAAFYAKQQGDMNKAYAYARLGAERSPEESASWQLLLWLATALRDSESIANYAEAAVELDPSFAPGWETLARIKLAESDWNAALKLAERALQADPSFQRAHIALGMAQGKLGRFEDALQSLETGLAGNARDVLALQMKAACLIQLGRKPDARQTLQIILALDPKNAWALARAAELK